ncbi:MAG: phosphatase PAP2 family protein [Acidimicrobiales bacterium]
MSLLDAPGHAGSAARHAGSAARHAGSAAGPVAGPDGADGPASGTRSAAIRRRAEHLRWWREVGVVLAFYAAYSFVRNRFGSASVGADEAYANALRTIDLERALGIFNEQALQRAALTWEPIVVAANAWYGSLHFAVTIGVLVVLYRRFPERYRRWRNVLAATTALALIGFALFPLMPPRLLCETCAHGAGVDHGFVDTLAAYPGSWSFGDGGLKAVSNQYAAMPSLHLAWALWCSAALWGVARRRGARAALVAYPSITLLAIVVTGNHFWVDALAGAGVLVAGTVVGTQVTRWRGRSAAVGRTLRRSRATLGAAPGLDGHGDGLRSMEMAPRAPSRRDA